MSETPPSDWEIWWNARVAAIENLLGPSDEMVGHAAVPFELGSDIGGAPDIIYFRGHVPGIVAVTSELIGTEDQVPNALGNYELMICDRQNIEWGEDIISRLAHYTLEAELNPGETLDLGEAVPDGSLITAFLFYDYGRFEVLGRKAGLLLCVGITSDELEACRLGRREEVEVALKQFGVFPFTDLERVSVLSS